MTLVYCQYMERGQVFQFRVSAVEKARIVELASGAGVSPSVWVRARALEQALGHPPAGGGKAHVVASGPSSPVPARASEPLSPTGEKLKQGYERQLEQAGVRPAREFVKPFRPLPKKS